VELYTAPPPGSTVICADELGPVIPRTFPPAPGWSGDGHRIKAPLEYSRGPEKTWVYGGLRVADGQAVTLCAPSRNSAFYQDFLQLAEQANPEGTIWVITDNLSSRPSPAAPHTPRGESATYLRRTGPQHGRPRTAQPIYSPRPEVRHMFPPAPVPPGRPPRPRRRPHRRLPPRAGIMTR
jgi:hypothetical protein